MLPLLQTGPESTSRSKDSDARVPEILHCQQAGDGPAAASHAPSFEGPDSRGEGNH